jgi:UPF0271 protein
MGESFGNYHIGNDQEIFPFITSSNIACGFHGGDAVHMENTIRAAIDHGVQIGAHPGYPDLAGFGRRKMDLPSHELKAIIKYQLAAIMGMAKSLGTAVRYVKPHGALYNEAADNERIAVILIESVQDINRSIPIMGLAGSQFQEICNQQEVTFVAEAFADRSYESSGKLRSRALEGAVITSPEKAVAQVLDIIFNKQITSHDGITISQPAQSICIHGDNPGAVAILKAIDQALQEKGVEKKSFT